MDISLGILREDFDFVDACMRQERWAQQKLYEEFYPSMLPLCSRYANSKDDALDIMHEGFIKVFKHITKYQKGTSLNSWVRRIMVNTAIDFYRKNVRRRTEDIDNVLDVTSREPNIISVLSAEEIIKSLQKLSPAYRTVFNLYVIEGFSHREVSEQLGISESTSRSNLVKARSKLRELLLAKEGRNGQA